MASPKAGGHPLRLINSSSEGTGRAEKSRVTSRAGASGLKYAVLDLTADEPGCSIQRFTCAVQIRVKHWFAQPSTSCADFSSGFCRLRSLAEPPRTRWNVGT